MGRPAKFQDLEGAAAPLVAEEVSQDHHVVRDELFDALRVGFAPLNLIERRKATYRAEIQIPLPLVIDVIRTPTIIGVRSNPDSVGL